MQVVKSFHAYCDVYGHPETADLLFAESARIRKEREGTARKLSEWAEQLVRINETVGTLETEVGKRRALEAGLKGMYSQCGKAASIVDVVRKWLSELSAQHQTTDLRASYESNRKSLLKAEQALSLAESLLAPSIVKDLESESQTLGNRLQAVDAKLITTAEEKDRLVFSLAKLEQEFDKINSKNQRIYEMVAQLERESHNTRVCLTCGYDWVNSDALRLQIQKQLKKLSKGVETTQAKAKIEIEHQLEKLRLKENNWSKEVALLEPKIRDMLKKLEKQQIATTRLVAQCQDAGFEFSRVINANLIGIPEDEQLRLKSFVEAIRHDVRTFETRIKDLWSGLREKEFGEKEQDLRDRVATLGDTLIDTDLTVPDGWTSKEWKSLGAILTDKRKDIKNELGVVQKQLSESERTYEDEKQKRNAFQTELDKLSLQNEKYEKQMTNLGEVSNAANRLLTWAFISRDEKLDADPLVEQIGMLIATVESLVGQVKYYLESQKKAKVLKEQLGQSKSQLTRNRDQLSLASGLSQQLKNLHSLEELELQVWAKYSATISDMFRKLHWPPDFAKVELEERNGELDLYVVLRDSPGTKEPAHQRMSAGQRAALAISVFWAFNTIADVPKLLLMDEPIQSIDDLNMLNFLDGLRWLVEKVGCQVFLTTANSRIHNLVRKKFSYLQEEYVELHLRRDQRISSIEYRDWQGGIINDVGKTA